MRQQALFPIPESGKPLSKISAARYLHSSKTVEWYTPPAIIQAARTVLNDIDLDPASCLRAQQEVRAKQYYTQFEDGLSQPWYGRVWLNPPYGRDHRGESNQGVWSRRLLREYEQGDVTSAILLVNASTGTKWFQPLWSYPICFVAKRIAFLDEHGVAQSNPTHDNALVYFGDAPERFAAVFATWGTIISTTGVVPQRLAQPALL